MYKSTFGGISRQGRWIAAQRSLLRRCDTSPMVAARWRPQMQKIDIYLLA